MSKQVAQKSDLLFKPDIFGLWELLVVYGIQRDEKAARGWHQAKNDLETE